MSTKKNNTATAKKSAKATPVQTELSPALTVSNTGDIEEVTAISETAPEVLAEIISLPVVVSEPEIQQAEIFNTPLVHDPQDILNSKKFVKGAFSFQSPIELLTPCIDAMSKTSGKLTLTGSHEATNANSDLTKNTSFGRLNLVSRYEIDAEMYYEVGILAAYDLSQPRLKIYRGSKVAACTNLCIFQAEDIVKFDINDGINMEQVNAFLVSISAKIQESVRIANQLKAIPIQESLMSQIMGKMLMNTVEKETLNGTTSILRATELFTDSKSKYYYKQPGFNGWQLFNAFTEHYAAKVNFFDIPEKTRDTYQLLKEICLS